MVTLLWDTQGEVEGDDLGFEKARRDVISKMASWSGPWHGSREYLLCYAAGGSRLRFYAVKMAALTPSQSQRISACATAYIV